MSSTLAGGHAAPRCTPLPGDVSDSVADIAFQWANSAIAVLDGAGRIRGVNSAFCRMSGRNRSDVRGMDPWRLVADRHGAGQSGRAEAALAAEGSWAGRVWVRRVDGVLLCRWMSLETVRGGTGRQPGRVAVWTDMTLAQRGSSDLEQLAYYDPLTGLPNRILFRDRLRQAVNHAGRSGRPFAVLFLDLDEFKRVNDTLGHGAGDELLLEVGRRLVGCLRASDTVSRRSGDEFTVILPDVSGTTDVAQVAAKILRAVDPPLRLRLHDVSVTTSVGIALFPRDGTAPDDLIHRADSAMYEVKQSGRNGFRFYSKEAQMRSAERLSMEQDLRRALRRNEFVLHFQPLVELRTGTIRAIEALVRWQHPRLGLVAPSRFIPVAEQARLIVPLGEWVMREAFTRAKAWRDAGLPAVVMAVNVAAQQLDQPDAAARIAKILVDVGLEPAAAAIEITESTAMRNPEATIERLLDLRDIGVSVAIDDFGTGYSSLSYLQRLPIGSLKIDRSFVHGVTFDAGAAAIAGAVISLAHALRLTVVAEGVETRAQLEFLREHECDTVQGFFYSRPVPEEAIVRLLTAAPRLVTPPGT